MRRAMPTPVSSARQYLAGEAAAALDDAVDVTLRRSHSQTTSLHVVSALLSLPSSSSLLRDALSRARSAAYSPRFQLKALDLCFSSALDRLPSSLPASASETHQPLVSNSLMAAIKRSQANQRRNPDTFHLYYHQYQQSQQQNQLQQQQQSSSSSFVGVKVELRQLVLSILDDPVVSRVFGEAGFRSSDVKLAVLRPPTSILRFPRAAAARCPPLFLCNFSLGADDFDFMTPRGLRPLCSDGAEANTRRVAEVLARNRGRSPVLVGAGAGDAARDFERAVVGQSWASFPPAVRGVGLFSVEREVSDLVRGGRRDPPWLGSRLAELALWLEAAPSPGVVVSVGDLAAMVEVGWEGENGDGSGAARYLVSELARLVEAHEGRLWVMGSAASYETYMEFLSQHPSVDKDWDLQLLPITSLKPGTGGLCPTPSSLMESFVPFGGFFPVASNSVSPLSRQYQSEAPCHLCGDKYDQELAALLKEFSVPVEEMCHMNLPQLRQNDPSSRPDVEKAKDDGTVLNAKVINLQKKWKDICQRLHRGSQLLQTGIFQMGSETLPHVIDLPCVVDKESPGNQTNRNIGGSQGENFQGYVFPASVSLQKISSVSRSISMPVVSEFVSGDVPSKLQSRPSKSEQHRRNDFRSHSGGPSDLAAPDEHTSSSSVISVSTDLILGTVHASLSVEEKSMVHPHTETLCELPGCLASENVDLINGNVSVPTVRYPPHLAYSDSQMFSTYLPVQTAPGPKVTGHSASTTEKKNLCLSNVCEPFDLRDFKTFCSILAERVGWQEEAIRAISQTLARCRTGSERLRGISLRGDIWLGFLGPDRVGKKKIAMVLAELLFGSRENVISVDLSLQGMPSNTLCNNQGTIYDLNFRGKTLVDYIAEEVRKKPCSVVLLENVDKADLLVQSSLSQAIRTGKFSDSYRREVGINNAVFVLTAGVKGKQFFSDNEHTKFSEEQILAARAWKMMILVDHTSDSVGGISCLDVSGTSMRKSRNECVFVSKRKLNMADNKEWYKSMRTAKQAKGASNTLLDLNLPVEEMFADDTAYCSDESSSISDNTEAWMEEFLDMVDETVFFKAFDFDALADDILKEINKSFHAEISSKCVLEIDPRVMDHILAATWLSESKSALSNWFQQVLVRSFIEAQQKCHLSSQSVLRLVACEDVFMEDHAPGILLPSRIPLG